MTYGSYGPGGPGPAPQDPYGDQSGYAGYPYGAYAPATGYPALPGGYPSAPTPGGYPPPPTQGGYPPPPGFGGYPPPPGPGGYPPPPGFGAYPPQPSPPTGTNILATLSIVFAFVFAPVGAVLGHLALGQIARTRQAGRTRALIGLTLSYAIIVLAVVGVTAMLVSRTSTDSPSVARSPGMTAAPGMPSGPGPKPNSGTDLSEVLLSLDEVRSIMHMPGLAPTESKKSGSGGNSDSKDASADPVECVGAVAPGIDTVYSASGATGYQRASFTDPSTASMVEQVAASFDSQAEARKFVTQSRDQWQDCAGERFTLSGGSSTLIWDLGTPGGTPTRVTLTNTLDAGPGVPQLRVLATRGTVVIDISVMSLAATDQAETIADQILNRIPS